jgi:hypothetical protein
VTIRPGEEWGTTVERPADLRVVHSDREIVEWADQGPVGLGGGDLFRSLGSPEQRDPVQRVDVDALHVVLDGRGEFDAVAHVIVRRAWWRGRIVVVMNVDHLAEWNIAPRAHPNDGRADIVDVAPAMSIRDRWAARQRLPQGMHVPHPSIGVSRQVADEWTFDRPHRVWIDGTDVGTATHVAVTVVPDRYVVYF